MEDIRRDDLVKVCDYADLADREPIGLDVAGEEVMVVRVGDQVYAIGNICSHAEAWLDSGYLHASTLEIECPLHEGKFDLRSGKATALPCVDPVKGYEVVRDGGQIFLVINESE
ncbi:non-heme iron oxygenase ferredoxin subunit [Mycobacterium vicinigordonae]|nr:non-heme iron oxygenase ferredoxin subunit [Mycobacterium vicinigordonae]